MEIKEEDVIKFYNFLGHKETTEIRLIKPKWCEEKTLPPSYFIHNSEELVNICKKFNGEWNIYLGINDRVGNGKNDDDVRFITNIGHDIDSHEFGDESIIIAGQVAIKIKEDCTSLGYKEPLIINSGFGYWVIHHISPLENNDENIKKIKEFGRRIREKYNQDKINIDSTVYNPSRISRVPGTLNLREKDKPIISYILNNPTAEEDKKLKEDILDIKLLKSYTNNLSANNHSINSFMDYCLTHEIPKGERHKVISRNMAIYISDHPDRELLKEQYCKIQKGSETELDQYLKNIDLNGKNSYPFSIGELINFTKKYKLPFDWRTTPEYNSWLKEKKATKKLKDECRKEEIAEQFGKAIKYFTDKRNLAVQFLKVQPLFYDENKIWWIWDYKNHCWGICDEVDIMNHISNHSEANTINSTEKNEILEALKQESRKNKPIPIEKTWIQFKDKIIDFYTNEEIKSNEKYFTVNPIPWELGIYTETPTLDRIFEEWVGKDYVKTLYEIIAYCLLIDYPINRIFCFIGSGMNGKSKFLEILRRFVGNSNCCSTELDSLINSRFEVTRLYKKMICLMGETNFAELNKTSMLKKLSGGDLIGFEYKGKNPFEEKNYAKILISTNNLPATNDKTIGFYRRWMIIDFPNQFTEKRDILTDIPDIEYNNLCLKSIENLKELCNKREFHNEGTIEERTLKFESKSNFLEKFIKEFTTEKFDGYITKSDFYKKFIAWSKENRHREMSETTVGLTLKKIGILEERKYVDWLYDGKGGQMRVWLGIIWK